MSRPRLAAMDRGRSGLLLWLIALGALLGGVLVYAFDRDPGHWLVPALGHAGALRLPAGLGWYLPSLTHSFTFALMVVLLWGGTRSQSYACCGLWALVEVVLELLQHPGASGLVGTGRQAFITPVSVPLTFTGTFSVGDLTAILIGALIAGWLGGRDLKEVGRD